MTRVTTALAVGWLTAAVAAQAPTADESRAAWRYRRAVAVPDGTAGAFVAVPLPPDVAARSQPHLEDIQRWIDTFEIGSLPPEAAVFFWLLEALEEMR